MKTFKEILSESAEKDSALEAHIAEVRKKLKLSANPTKRLSKFLMYKSDLQPQEIFDILVKMGYKKGSGYDSKPKEWTGRTDYESMTYSTDPIFYRKDGNLFMTSVRAEHGSKVQVLFQIQ
jgi:hypothetical protein